MSRKVLGLMGAILVGLPLLAQAEPISFEQAANVTGLTGIEAGIEFDYAYEEIEADGQSTVSNSVMDLPVFVRLGFPVLEAKLTIPYGSVKSNVAAAEEENYSGMRDLGIGLKTGLLGLPVFNLAAGLNFNLPTGDVNKHLGEGLNLYPFLAADLNIMIMKLHANLGYEYRGQYDLEITGIDSSGNPIVESQPLKPGDATHWALGVEIPTGNVFTLHAELKGTSYGDAKSGSDIIEGSKGQTMTFYPGISVKQGIFKAKVGVGIPLEDENDRPNYAERSDWRILGSASLIFAF